MARLNIATITVVFEDRADMTSRRQWSGPPTLVQKKSVYGVPTKVVTLCAFSDTVTRDCDTLTADPAPRFLLAEVS